MPERDYKWEKDTEYLRNDVRRIILDKGKHGTVFKYSFIDLETIMSIKSIDQLSSKVIDTISLLTLYRLKEEFSEELVGQCNASLGIKRHGSKNLKQVNHPQVTTHGSNWIRHGDSSRLFCPECESGSIKSEVSKNYTSDSSFDYDLVCRCENCNCEFRYKRSTEKND